VINRLFNKFRSAPLYALLFILVGQPVHLVAMNLAVTETNKLFEQTIKQLIPQKPEAEDNYHETPTIAHLAREVLREKVLDQFAGSMCYWGTDSRDYLPYVFSTTLGLELNLSSSHNVFYHQLPREFMLPQDIYNGLYYIFHKKPLKDFFILRDQEDRDLKQFGSINDFLNDYIANNEPLDELSHISKQIISVNVSLFGNCQTMNESSFTRFLRPTVLDNGMTFDFVKSIFTQFKCPELYETYMADLQELRKLLQDIETGTSLLLQIFIPTAKVNKLVYPCIKCGRFRYADKKPENHPISVILQNYKSKRYVSRSFELRESDADLNALQCRILMNPDLFNPTNDIKIFRYCLETPSVKMYKEKLAILLEKIAKNLASMQKTTSDTFTGIRQRTDE